MTPVCTLTGGALGRMYDEACAYFLGVIDPMLHAAAYRGIHKAGFAETEFAGKYLDTCVRFARTAKTKDLRERALARAHAVKESILACQREDGYIGGHAPGSEKVCFSVWNQAFTMIGLLSYYELTGDRTALEAAERIAVYNASIFMDDDSILLGGNNGSQHLSIILPLARLCRVSENPVVPRFLQYIIDLLKGSDNNFFGFSSILDLRSKKGIENFVILLGLLEYGDLTGDVSALDAAKRYWDELASGQIRENGNGTVREVWTAGGNLPQMLSEDVKPDENCVAVGWIEFSLALYRRTGGAKYLDAVETALYNHLLGAVGEGGSAFAYYQPNFGRRSRATPGSMYKCCRYRGYSAVSQLTGMLFENGADAFSAMIYTDASYEDDRLRVTETAAYPYDENVSFEIEAKQDIARVFRFRVPADADGATVCLDEKPVGAAVSDGWLTIPLDLTAGKKVRLSLSFALSVKGKHGVIDGEKRALYRYGCILLAAQAKPGEAASLTLPEGKPVRTETANENIAFTLGGVRLCDYASSGRGEDEFVIWAKE